MIEINTPTNYNSYYLTKFWINDIKGNGGRTDHHEDKKDGDDDIGDGEESYTGGDGHGSGRSGDGSKGEDELEEEEIPHFGHQAHHPVGDGHEEEDG